MGESGGSSLRLYWHALKQVRPWWPGQGAVLALGILWTPISLLVPLPVKIILERDGPGPLPSWLAWLPGGPEAALGVALGLSVGITALVLAHNTAEWLLRESLTERVVRDMRRRLAARSLEVSARGPRGSGTRDTASRTMRRRFRW